MADIRDEKLGTRGEYEMRDDDRPGDTPYAGRRRVLGSPAFVIAVLVLLGLTLGYMYLDRGSHTGVDSSPSAPEATRSLGR